MARFSRQTYEMVADTLAGRYSMVDEGGEGERVLDFLVCDFTDLFAEDNRRFVPKRFVGIAGASKEVCRFCGRWASDPPDQHRSGCALRKAAA